MSAKLSKILNKREDYYELRKLKDYDDFQCLEFKFKDDGIESTYFEEDLVLKAFFPYNKDMPYGIEFTQYKEKYYGDKFDSFPIILSFFEMNISSYTLD